MTVTFAPAVAMTERRPVFVSSQRVEREAPDPTDLRIDGWLVQPMLNLLTRGDVRVRVRAQLMDLLVCLASRPGKVFQRNEIVAEVWDGRWIAESALSRCVAELRAALRRRRAAAAGDRDDYQARLPHHRSRRTGRRRDRVVRRLTHGGRVSFIMQRSARAP